MQNNLIVEILDEELDRLRQMRAILAPLLQLSRIPQVQSPILQPAREAAKPQEKTRVPLVTITRLPSREPRKRRLRASQPIEQPTELKGAIPNAPVVFRPSAPKLSESAPKPLPRLQPGSFAALVRAAEREMQSI